MGGVVVHMHLQFPSSHVLWKKRDGGGGGGWNKRGVDKQGRWGLKISDKGISLLSITEWSQM